MIKPGEKLYTGAIATAQFAAAYNRLTRQILDFERAGRKPPESLLNGRHNVFNAFALANIQEE